MPTRKIKLKKKFPKVVKAKVLANNAAPAHVAPPKPKLVRQPKMRGSAVGQHHIRGVCSITDPFCVAAKAGKWPDGTSGNTLTEQFRGNVTISSLAAGNNMYIFSPSAPYGYLRGNTSTATTVSTAFSWDTYKTGGLLSTFGNQYRVVTFGVVIRCVASATSASGLMTLGTTSPPVTVPITYTLGQELYAENIVKAIQPGMEMTWISQPRGTQARAFVPKNTSTTVNTDEDWTALAIELSGCPASTAMVNVEWYMNIEFTPGDTGSGNALTALAKPNPPASTHATSATSAVHASLGSFVEGGIKNVEARVADAASKALNSFLSDPLASIAGLFAL
jgi:hypothetical protein